MSIKKWLAASFLLLSAGLSAAYLLQNSSLYSYSSNGATTVTPHQPVQYLQSKFSSKGVVNRVIQLKMSFTKASSNSDKVDVDAKVRMPFDFNNKLYFKWKLGPGVAPIEGQLSGEITALLKDEPKTIHLTVTGFSKETNHQIGFEVYGLKDGKSLYGDAVIASDLERTFENTVQNVEQLKEKTGSSPTSP